MRSSPDPEYGPGWRAFLEEARRRGVHRALTLYGAVVWAVVAAAPDLIQYLGAPSWVFPSIVVALIVGLPVVLATSWFLEFTVSGERPVAREGGTESRGDGPANDDVDEGEGGAGPWARAFRWAAPILLLVALVAVAKWGFDDGDGDGARLRVGLQGDSAGVAIIRPPLEWLLGAETLRFDATDGSARAALSAARREGATYIVTATGSPRSVSVALYHRSSVEPILLLSGGGASGSEEVGRLALHIVSSIAQREEIRLPVEPDVMLQTASPAALFHLIEGQRWFSATDFDAAASAFDRAIEADSSFIAAYYRRAVLERWRWDYAAGWAVLQKARSRDLSPRWRRLVDAQLHYLRRRAGPALAGYEQATLHNPELREGWLGLGEALFHYGGFLGHNPQTALRPLRRALAGDSMFAPVGHHLVELALWNGDPDAARRALPSMAPGHPVRPVMETAIALTDGTPAQRADAWATVQGWDLRLLSLLTAHFACCPPSRATADSAAAILYEPGRLPEERLRGAQYRLMLAADSGAWERALADWRAVETAPFDTWAVHAYQAGRPIPEAEAMLAWADRQRQAGRIPDFALPLNHDLRRAFNALVHDAVLTADSARVDTLLRSIAAAGTAHPTDPAPEILPAALRARLALLAHDSTLALDYLTVATSRTHEPFVTFYPASTMAPERLLLIRLNEALGRAGDAARWRSSFHHSISLGDLLYRSWVTDVAEAPLSPEQGGIRD